MTVQTASALLTVAITLVIAAVFLAVRISNGASSDYAPIQRAAYRRRRVLFWGMVLIGLPVSVYLLRDAPYPRRDVTSAQVVNATATQWAWELSAEEVRAGVPVEFHVTATDVNHGFGLYDESGRLIAQTQAMPGYVNRLRHVFTTPGSYRVLCLEYCGLAHHGMAAQLNVVE